jgi:hypothetical protein
MEPLIIKRFVRWKPKRRRRNYLRMNPGSDCGLSSYAIEGERLMAAGERQALPNLRIRRCR